MVIDLFLKIDGVDGESSDDRHRNEIALLSFSWGEAQLTSAGGAGTGGSAGKVTVQDFHFTTLVNKSSPRLFLACAKGEHFKTAVLTVRRTCAQPTDFFIWRLSNIVFSAYQSSAELAGGTLPTDHVSMGFSKIELEYRPMNPDGTPGAAVKAGWDLTTGRSI